MMKKISPKREKTRQRLIEAAAKAIADKGFRETSLDEIAAGAGLTKGAIYDNFKSKDELFMAVMASRPDRLPFPPRETGDAAARMAAMARSILEDYDGVQIPLRAEFLLYTLNHPEMQAQMESWLKMGSAAESAAALEAFSPEELPMSPQAFVVMLQAMIPGLMYMRSNSAEVVSDEIVAEIFASLARKP